jgi:hypothetical protein
MAISTVRARVLFLAEWTLPAASVALLRLPFATFHQANWAA